MGRLWLQTSEGKKIHIPIVEEDVNTPDTAILIPDTFKTRDRCYSGQIQINHPTLGTITINFDPPGRTGSCNQCGQCCSHLITDCKENICGYVIDGNYHRCQYLTILKGQNKGIGQINGTECKIRTTIFDIVKGCVFFPETAAEIANFPACGFSFGV